MCRTREVSTHSMEAWSEHGVDFFSGFCYCCESERLDTSFLFTNLQVPNTAQPTRKGVSVKSIRRCSIHELSQRDMWVWVGLVSCKVFFALGISLGVLRLSGLTEFGSRNWFLFLISSIPGPFFYRYRKRISEEVRQRAIKLGLSHILDSIVPEPPRSNLTSTNTLPNS